MGYLCFSATQRVRFTVLPPFLYQLAPGLRSKDLLGWAQGSGVGSCLPAALRFKE